MKNTNKIVFGIITILIIILVIFYTQKKTNSPTVGDKYASSNSEISVASFATEKSETEYLTINTVLPIASQEKFPELYNFVDGLRREFMHNFDSLTPEDIKFIHLGGDRKYDFTVSTKVATSTNTVTYIIEVYSFTGGAHGGTEVGTFTYDKEGKFVTLDSVLEGDYLTTLSALSRKYFYDILGESSLKSGTEPKQENFSSWYLTQANIIFIFGQYSVGPYSFGIQEFSIPKTSISNLISPKFK